MELKDLKKSLKYLFWEIYGRRISNPEIPSNPTSILFVCKGNICRSPFAEGIAKKYFVKRNVFTYSSAGIHVTNPLSPPPEAILAAKMFEVNLENHLSKPINSSMFKSFDMIFTMETWQHVYLNKNFPMFRKKLFLLPMLENKCDNKRKKYYSLNIVDPYGRTLEDYVNCYERIKICLCNLMSTINTKSSNHSMSK